MKTATVVGTSLLVLTLAGAAAASQAVYERGEVSLELGEVTAFRVRHMDRFATSVFFTKTPLDRDAIARAGDPEAAAHEDPATEGSFAALEIEDDGSTNLTLYSQDGGWVTGTTTGGFLGQPATLSTDCAEASEERIECVVSTPEPVELPGGETWTFRAEVEAEVIPRVAGRPLGPGGGAPGRALSDLAAALESEDVEAILPLLAEPVATSIREISTPEDQRQYLAAKVGRRVPRQMEVIGGELLGEDVAEVLARGTLPGLGFEGEVLVTMVREGDRWVFRRQELVRPAD